MTTTQQIKKTPIGEIGKNQHKVTIADEVELETYYHFEPPLRPSEVIMCWLDPSEQDFVLQPRCKFVHPVIGSLQLTYSWAELLQKLIPSKDWKGAKLRVEEYNSFSWVKVKGKVLRKYNLSDLLISARNDYVSTIAIKSRQPLYDQNAHANRVRNVLRAVKNHYPNVVFEHEGCFTSGACPMGIIEALRKVAEEAHGKVSA